MPSFKIQPPVEHDVVPRTGSIRLEYGVKGTELEQKLRQAQDQFIRAMEVRGLTLMRLGKEPNPKWITDDDGSMAAFYAIDWIGERPVELAPDGNPLPRTRESSLDDTWGMVEYRVVGVFWGPKTSVEILRTKADILDEERQARDPRVFGYGSAGGGDPLTPDKELIRNAEHDEGRD